MFDKIVGVLIAVAVVIGVGGLFSSAKPVEAGDSHDHQKTSVMEPSGGATKGDGKAHDEGREAEEIGNTTCPVSGESIDEKMKVTYEYKGKVYSFCCQGCVEEFKKDPDKYIEKMHGKGSEDRQG